MEKEIDAATPPVLDRSQDPHEAPKRIGFNSSLLVPWSGSYSEARHQHDFNLSQNQSGQ